MELVGMLANSRTSRQPLFQHSAVWGVSRHYHRSLKLLLCCQQFRIWLARFRPKCWLLGSAAHPSRSEGWDDGQRCVQQGAPGGRVCFVGAAPNCARKRPRLLVSQLLYRGSSL